MNSKLLHTPVGVRDIYNEECEQKLHIQEVIHSLFKSYGYRDIQTPTFEFFDIFNKERGSVASKNMYKFFDREGNTLVLRPDMTPSIARSVAKYFAEETMPVRLCYCGNTFINNNEYQGKLKEFTQIGSELLGDNTSDADAEVVAMVIETLIKSGLKEFQIEIGQVDFFKGLVEEAGLDEETIEKLIELLENKKYFGINDLLSNSSLSDEQKVVFEKYPELFGTLEMIEYAKTLTKNERSLSALDRLEKLYKLLQIYGYEKYVSFDLSMLSMYQYYTGIIFKGYTYGTGDAIVTGGRYDNLIGQFGKDYAAIGFAVNLDQLMVALSRQHLKPEIKTSLKMVLYSSDNKEEAIKITMELRNNNMNVITVRKRSDNELWEYEKHAFNNNVDEIIYITKDGTKSYTADENGKYGL